ncbi:translation initiation factor IF-5A [Promethearchaeum syntrophicum]|uniref:Translation initiation factor IF-5A n=1 Tax=Promethearchaeum syntrophicum TaxID=2594042 RepID=A0A5B9DA28_9ARCH|nr:translation initiation factor IF-5A [Candidatus Prometheoarchaeum syntrophicum]QEE15697.1 Translation initiation factor 5A [Candidatus Prometheoarchaeum syntrophicum]
MARKTANNLKKGNYFIFEGEPYLVSTNDHSKSGKHGHAKSRIGCQGLFTKKKKSMTFTADTSLDVPEIEKKSGQLVDIDDQGQIVHVMDLETYETMELMYPFEEDELNLKKLEELMHDHDLQGETTIEFWTVMGKSFVTRVNLPK